ncbi:1-acyl-sn-glycerol-3-phosphate acyltransferase [Alicyclobacillus sp. SO9]|uniref:lysophospholipid acyltransferase family protein n=1 Tax=Alicyclobacillus sp. SO9 TaxID=2665646 RepID=UPI0018E79270|nr:lysophospholipid acyltransferase family protein [Alicyclobacillus sp. SO9]QQE76829.1 1-acyl-sn-glycerol-3-phosphate acyltransferase [Alicyclobacillus sp. SO9]
METVKEYHSALLYRFARSAVTLFFKMIFRYRVIGQQHVPQSGAAVICSNHIHNLDPPVLGLSTTRYVHFMAKDELFRVKPLGWLIYRLGAFPVRRGGQDKGAIRKALAIPAQGSCLVVFPEGHRSKDGKLGRGMMGASFIARKANCPIVPAAIIGTYKIGRRLTVRFGEPIMPEPQDTNESLMERIMQHIALLIEQDSREQQQ